ncbi:TPA: helix-turn-helix domain-containing protein [Escherichia coli]|nr:helix-turn-helix domain-containing protein [Escherichia coli]
MKAYWDSLTKEQQGELAGKVGSTPGYLRLVFNGYKKASFVLAKKLEQCTSGAITKSDLRPDTDHSLPCEFCLC